MQKRRDLATLAATVVLILCAMGGAYLSMARQGPTGPQLPLPSEPLTIIDDDGHAHVFQVEMATTPREQETGLMFRPSVPSDSGMLFIFPAVKQPYSLAAISSQGPVKAVLELQGGLTAKEHISVGDHVTAPQFSAPN